MNFANLGDFNIPFASFSKAMLVAAAAILSATSAFATSDYRYESVEARGFQTGWYGDECETRKRLESKIHYELTKRCRQISNGIVQKNTVQYGAIRDIVLPGVLSAEGETVRNIGTELNQS